LKVSEPISEKGTNMQNPSTIPTNNQPRVFGHVTPEIHEALRTLKASEFRLEAEFYSLDIESRFEFAEELRTTLDALDDNHVDELARVIDDLEDIDGADFTSWDERTDAAARIRRVIRSVEKEVTANA
jgi:erythromycin esterase-like protein